MVKKQLIKKMSICLSVIMCVSLLAGCRGELDADSKNELAINSGTTETVTESIDGAEEFAGSVEGDVEKRSAVDIGEADEAPAADEGKVTEEVIEIEDAQSGVLTAGRWNDNDNWGFFMNLVKSQTFKFPSYGINPCNRISISLKNDDEKPVPNTKAVLKDESGKAIWESVTDKEGKAYLFYDEDDKPSKVVVVPAEGDESSFDINVESSDANDNQSRHKDEINEEYVINSKAEKYKNMDIMFVCDATGSMSDEMLFLQLDFADIAKKTGDKNTKYAVNFYRDEGDEYITKCFDFTKDIDEVQDNINSQSADGGGDEPEAVAQVLDESVNKSSWRDKSTKLMFLIFDAPPHDDDNTINMINECVKEASKKGIRIIPVVSSNAQRETEIFGRAIAICTNGDYVFLTDDSGVGSSHLEPVIGDYEVKTLNETIVEIIEEYRK